MKKLHQLLLAFLLCTSVQNLMAQHYNETEPNNSFATANLLKRFPDTLLATIGGSDAIDYFKVDLSYYTGFNWTTGTLVVDIVATNTGSSASSLKAELFNGLQGAGLLKTENFSGSIAPGASITRSIIYCGAVSDDYFVAVTTGGQFSYRVNIYYSDANPNTEPNNTRASASSISYDTVITKRQAINYQYRQDPYTDTVDYLKTVFPPGSYGNIALEIKAKNNGCASGKWIQYALFRNNDVAPFATGYVGNNSSVLQFSEVFSSIPLSNMLQGDALIIKIWSNAPFGYELRYRSSDVELEDETYDVDPEGYSYEFIGENETKVAQVGYQIYENGLPLYDDDGNPVIDNYDSYQFTLPQDGAITLYVKARNDGCSSGLYFDLEDEYGNSISNMDYIQIASWNGSCSEIVYTIKTFRAFTAGSYRLRIYNSSYGYDERVSYTLKYLFLPYTNGGSNDAEPNSSQASALCSPVKHGSTSFVMKSSTH
ncbi:MAG: hypothetical protein EON98_01050 [Chitinophagaceae bacterium]|nr:MAG: hypothetical protein EON98_01050 [Chitinophagaceae bacterium]